MGTVIRQNGAGTDSCVTGTTACNLGNEAVYIPGQMSFDGSSNLFFANSFDGAAESTALTSVPTFINLYAPFTYQEAYLDAFAVDSGDNLYSFWGSSSDPNCQIVGQTLYNATHLLDLYNKIAGGRTCGFSGDGGLAANAEISKVVSGISFDTGGNMYFTDTNNQRVRRVDRSTGIIRTVAGNGTAGYTGDGLGSTGAELASPTGVGVDSQGQVYIISGAAPPAPPRWSAKSPTAGFRNSRKCPQGRQSATRTLIVTNTGNSASAARQHRFTAPNPPNSQLTRQLQPAALTPGATLQSGQTCQIAFIARRQAPVCAQLTSPCWTTALPSPTSLTFTSPAHCPWPPLKSPRPPMALLTFPARRSRSKSA